MRRLAGLVTAAILAVGVAAAPAHAADEIGLSNDGVTWSDQLSAPLFDSSFIWVPGDVEERSFFVRNDGPSIAELSVDIQAEDPEALLANDDFFVEARLGSGPWVNIEQGTTEAGPTIIEVPQGAEVSVTIRGTFQPMSVNENGTIPLRATIFLSEDGSVGGVDDGNGNGGGAGGGDVGGVDSDLPDTGASVDRGLIWLAAGLIGAGMALVLPRRRRHEGVARA